MRKLGLRKVDWLSFRTLLDGLGGFKFNSAWFWCSLFFISLLFLDSIISIGWPGQSTHMSVSSPNGVFEHIQKRCSFFKKHFKKVNLFLHNLNKYINLSCQENWEAGSCPSRLIGRPILREEEINEGQVVAGELWFWGSSRNFQCKFN